MAYYREYDLHEGYRGIFEGYWFDSQGRLDYMPDDVPVNKSLTKLRAQLIHQLKKNGDSGCDVLEYRFKYNPDLNKSWNSYKGRAKAKVIGKIWLSNSRYEHHTYHDVLKGKRYVLNPDGTLGRVLAPGEYATKR